VLINRIRAVVEELTAVVFKTQILIED